MKDSAYNLEKLHKDIKLNNTKNKCNILSGGESMRKKVVTFVFFIIIFISSAAFAGHNRYEVHFIDTGQSDCILIKSLNKNYLIDTGAAYYTNKILEYLNVNGINNIEAIILTHYHDDHYGGLLKIVQNKKVNKVYIPTHYNEVRYDFYKTLIENNISVKYINKGWKLKQGKINLEAIGPIKEDKIIENNNSIVLQGKIDGIKYLFAADCEKQEEKDMINSIELKQCDVLKIPHHSLNTSSTDGFLDRVKPKIAVVTCNGVETPDYKVIRRISRKCPMIFRTDINGNVIVKDGFVKGTKDEIGVKISRR